MKSPSDKTLRTKRHIMKPLESSSNTLESYRKMCLAQQTELRRALLNSKQHARAIQLFLRQHAMLHSASMARAGLWSFEDAVLDDMPE